MIPHLRTSLRSFCATSQEAFVFTTQAPDGISGVSIALVGQLRWPSLELELIVVYGGTQLRKVNLYGFTCFSVIFKAEPKNRSTHETFYTNSTPSDMYFIDIVPLQI